MNSKKIGLILFSIVLLTFSTEILASSAGFGFHGKIVTSTCEVRHKSDAGTFKAARFIEVSPGITVAVNSAFNACGDEVWAIIASFRALTSTSELAAGVVTLTYH